MYFEGHFTSTFWLSNTPSVRYVPSSMISECGLKKRSGQDAIVLGGYELDSAVLLVGEGEVRHGGAVGPTKGIFDEASADSDELAFGCGA